MTYEQAIVASPVRQAIRHDEQGRDFLISDKGWARILKDGKSREAESWEVQGFHDWEPVE